MNSQISLACRHALTAATALYIASLGLASHAQEKASEGYATDIASPNGKLLAENKEWTGFCDAKLVIQALEG